MNRLSWLLYGADVAGSVSVLLAVGLVIAIVGTVIPALFGFFTRESNRSYGEDDHHFKQGNAVLHTARRYFWIPIVIAVILVVVPHPQTIYAIAASEVGEDVLDSPTGGKAVKALNAWLDRQLSEVEVTEDAE